MGSTYYIQTFGCQMNVHESEKLAGILETRGYTLANELSEADVIVFNTCCVRETAETRAMGNLGSLKNLKLKKPALILAVCGCMVQKRGAAEALKKRFPYVNLFFGTHNLHKFGEYLDSYKGGQFAEVWESGTLKSDSDVPIRRSKGVNAWVNIMYGCNNFCSYCIVPYVRGRERSRPMRDIVSDVRNLLNEGYKEITLLGQNVNSYGNDLTESSTNFAALLSALSDCSIEYKLKFMTSHPKDLTESVVRVMAQSPVIVDYIHLPLQAGSDRILALMNRKYSAVQYLDTVEMIRKHIPNAGISSDIMVGFPSETEEDFLYTMKMAQTVRFNNLYTFIYSRRSGTPADVMEQIPLSVKRERIRRLIDAQAVIGAEQSAALVGRTFRVLLEEVKNGVGRGKTHCEKEISFEADEALTGTFVDVVAIRHKNTKLYGSLRG